MWTLLFRSKISIDKALAVERCRREAAEREVRQLDARLERTETEFARLRDATLMKQGVIHAPLRTEPSRPASPLASFVGALSLTEYDQPPSTSRETMPDA